MNNNWNVVFLKASITILISILLPLILSYHWSFLATWKSKDLWANCYSRLPEIPFEMCQTELKRQKQFARLKCEIPSECSCSLKRIKHTDCWICLVLSQKASDLEADIYYPISLSDPIAIPPLPFCLPLKGKHNLFCSPTCFHWAMCH